MASIFYDLETTDLCPIGQILNCCFIALDEQWNEIGRFTRDIRISPLQLPSPRAVLANRTAVLDHQQQATATEPEAMRDVHSFIGSIIAQSNGPVELIGYNSSKFDVRYLRTSLIRNGLDPYFHGKLIPKDVLYVARQLSSTRPEFPRRPSVGASGEAERQLSLRLETLATAFGLMSGPQQHHSVADVEVTIELAKLFTQEFGIDVRRSRAYSALDAHTLGTQNSVVAAVTPDYDLCSGRFQTRTPYTLVCAGEREGLWVDLVRYREGAGRDAIRWMNEGTGYLRAEVDSELARTFAQDAQDARREFEGLTVRTFFAESTCDIEADIFRLSPRDRKDLNTAIWYGNVQPLTAHTSPDAQALYIRYKLAHADWSKPLKGYEQRLHTYAMYRYGGACNVQKSHLEKLDPAIAHPAAHPTFNELLVEIDQLRGTTVSDEDHRILSQLVSLYEDSPVVKIAGADLRALQRANPLSLDSSSFPYDTRGVRDPQRVISDYLRGASIPRG